MMEISQKLKAEIDYQVKSGSAKEKVYDAIDKLLSGNYFQEEYLREPLNLYVFNKNETYRAYSLVSSIEEEIVNNISYQFKEVNDSTFLAHFDKKLIERFVRNFLDCRNNDTCSSYNKSKVSIAERIGEDRFKSWLKDNDPELLLVEVSNLVNEAVSKYDTHRYSDEMLECLVEALGKPSFANAVSDCQYAHKVGSIEL